MGQNLAAQAKKEGVDECVAATYVAWNIWKERNRRIFRNEQKSVEGVCLLIRDDLGLLMEARE